MRAFPRELRKHWGTFIETSKVWKPQSTLWISIPEQEPEKLDDENAWTVQFLSVLIECLRAGCNKWALSQHFLLMPPGTMSLKIPAGRFSFFFFFSVKNVHFNWIIGFSGTHDVFFCREQIQQRDAGDVLWQNSSKSIVFLVVAIFAKTKCYSPSNLLVRSAMCRISATYQLLTCQKWYVQHVPSILWSF